MEVENSKPLTNALYGKQPKKATSQQKLYSISVLPLDNRYKEMRMNVEETRQTSREQLRANFHKSLDVLLDKLLE